MSSHEARKLAESISLEDLKAMFRNAAEKTTDWHTQSSVNRGMTKGTSFNLFTKGDFEKMPHVLAVKNMIWEFGEFLPNYSKPQKAKKSRHCSRASRTKI